MVAWQLPRSRNRMRLVWGGGRGAGCIAPTLGRVVVVGALYNVNSWAHVLGHPWDSDSFTSRCRPRLRFGFRLHAEIQAHMRIQIHIHLKMQTQMMLRAQISDSDSDPDADPRSG